MTLNTLTIRLLVAAIVTCVQLYTMTRFGQETSLNVTHDVTSKTHASVRPKSTSTATLTFVKYVSSPWEQHWIDNIHKYEKDETICEQLLGPDAAILHDFMKYSCTTTIHGSDWCGIDDEVEPIYYNTARLDTFDIRIGGKWLNHLDLSDPKPVLPDKNMNNIYSYLLFRNDDTGELVEDYIEPLVSHLRHPLAGCVGEKPTISLWTNVYDVLMGQRGYILPPQHLSSHKKSFKYFDAGASSWDKGAGGPSIKFFVKFFQRYGIVFDKIFAFEGNVNPSAFYKSIPNNWKDRIEYQQIYVSSSKEEDSEKSPFLPAVISRSTCTEDYVMFKLDIDSPRVEEGSIDYILENANTTPIDELFWEHHVKGNYILARSHWKRSLRSTTRDMTLKQSYDYFLKLRQLGIRAHSWV